jgi:hypothetical protein
MALPGQLAGQLEVVEALLGADNHPHGAGVELVIAWASMAGSWPERSEYYYE